MKDIWCKIFSIILSILTIPVMFIVLLVTCFVIIGIPIYLIKILGLLHILYVMVNLAILTGGVFVVYMYIKTELYPRYYKKCKNYWNKNDQGI